MLAIAAAAPAAAQRGFEAYDGPNAEVVGQGGTKVSVDGFDYWTSGSPPRRFKILGAFVDRRATGRLAGEVAGSKSVARKAREAGGDAVIIGATDRVAVGTSDDPPSMSFDGQMKSRGTSIDAQRQTRILVVKYLN